MWHYRNRSLYFAPSNTNNTDSGYAVTPGARRRHSTGDRADEVRSEVDTAGSYTVFGSHPPRTDPFGSHGRNLGMKCHTDGTHTMLLHMGSVQNGYHSSRGQLLSEVLVQ